MSDDLRRSSAVLVVVGTGPTCEPNGRTNLGLEGSENAKYSFMNIKYNFLCSIFRDSRGRSNTLIYFIRICIHMCVCVYLENVECGGTGS